MSRLSLLPLLFACACAQAAVLELEGLEGPQRGNVLAHFGTGPEGKPGQEALRQAAREAVEAGLRPLGYYEPRVEWLPVKDPDTHVRAKVRRGPPVVLRAARILVEGEGRDDPVFAGILARGVPRAGQPVNHGRYSKVKSELQQAALEHGYFEAKFTTAHLAVSRQRREAVWDMVFDTGHRWKFGRVSFPDACIEDSYLQSLVPWKEGDPWDAGKLQELNTALAESGWFQSAAAAGRFAEARDRTVPVTGQTEPRRKNRMSVGLQYGSDSGPGANFTWKKPWFSRRGHSLTAALEIDREEQEATMTYRIPVESSPVREYWDVEGGYKHTSMNDTESDAATAGLARYWNEAEGWQKAVTLRWSLTHFTQADVTTTARLFYPGLRLSRVRTRGGMMPLWGDSQTYSLQGSTRAWGSTADFLIFQAQHTWIRTIAHRHRFLLRGNFGWMQTADLDDVPPELRFFAGGDRSIRGYGYQKISPKNAEGQLTGASKLLTGSVEYQFRVHGAWWGAVFWDAGEAVNEWEHSDWKMGAGAGVRWSSPVGVVRLDVARPLGDAEARGVQIYIGLGAEL